MQRNKDKNKIQWKYILAFGAVAILFASVFFGVSSGFAQVEDFSQPVLDNTGLAQGSLLNVVTRVINIFLGFLGLVALIIIITAGVIWMTSGGNPEKIKQAKKLMLNAAIGLGIVLGAAVIANFIFWLIARSLGNGDPNLGNGNVPGGCVGANCFLPAPSDQFKLVNHSPRKDEAEVKACRAVQGTFNAKVDEVSLSSAFSLENTVSGAVTTASSGGDLAFSEDGKAFRYRLSAGDMELNNTYHAEVNTDVAAASDAGDLAGLRMATPRAWDFTTSSDPARDNDFPRVEQSASVYSVLPSETSTNVCLNTPIQVVFNEEMDITTLRSSNIFLLDGETGAELPLRSVRIGADLKSFMVFPVNPLERSSTGGDRTYTVKLYTTDETAGREGFEDVCGNPLNGDRINPELNQAADFEWIFSTSNQSTAECFPEIRSVTPTITKYNTQVAIAGARFGLFGDVRIGNITADTISCSDSSGLNQEACVTSWTQELIQVRIPIGATTDKVTVAMGELESKSQETVEVNSPYLSRLRPDPVRLEELLTLVGNNFGSTRGHVDFIQDGEIEHTISTTPTMCSGNPSATWNNNSATVYIGTSLFAGTYGVRLRTKDSNEFSNIQYIKIEDDAARPGLCGAKPDESAVPVAVEAEGIHLNRVIALTVNPTIEIAATDFTVKTDALIKFTVPTGTETGYITPIYLDSLSVNAEGTPAWFRVLSGVGIVVDPCNPGDPGCLIEPPCNPGDPDCPIKPPCNPGDPDCDVEDSCEAMGTCGEVLPEHPQLLWIHPETPSPQNCSITLGFDRPMNVGSVIANTVIDFGGIQSSSGVGVSSGRETSFVPSSGNQWPVGDGSVYLAVPSSVVDTQGNTLDCDNWPGSKCKKNITFKPTTDPVDSVNITPTNVDLVKNGSSREVTAIVAGEHCGDGINISPVWSSDDEDVANVTETADSRVVSVSPVNIGATHIAAAADSKTDRSSVTVTWTGPDAPEFYVLSVRPKGVDRFVDEIIEVHFNKDVDVASLTANSITVQHSSNPGDNIPIEIDGSNPRRITAQQMNAGEPVDWIKSELDPPEGRYTVHLDASVLKLASDSSAILDCTYASGFTDPAECKYVFAVEREAAPVIDVNFTEDFYTVEWSKNIQTRITVLAGHVGEAPYTSSQFADFVVSRGAGKVVPRPNPHPPAQVFRIFGKDVGRPQYIESDIRAWINNTSGDTIKDTEEVDVIPCTGAGCEMRVNSLAGVGVFSGSTCQNTFALNLNKAVDTANFPFADIVVEETIAGTTSTFTPIIDSSTPRYSKRLIFGSLTQDSFEDSSVSITYTPTTLPSYEPTALALLEQISQAILTGDPWVTGDPRDVNKDGVINAADITKLESDSVAIASTVTCSTGRCSTAYELSSADLCAGGPGSTPFYVSDVGPSGDNVALDEAIVFEFNEDIDAATVTAGTITATNIKDSKEINLALIPAGNTIRAIPDPLVEWAPNSPYRVQLDTTNLRKIGSPIRRVDCSAIPGRLADDCSFEFTATHAPGDVQSIIFTPDRYTVEWSKAIYTSVEVIAGYEDRNGDPYQYASSQPATFSITAGGLNYISALTDPPTGQQFQIVGTGVGSIAPAIQASIGGVNATAAVEVKDCIADGCNLEVVSLIAGGSQSCQETFTLTLNKPVDTSNFDFSTLSIIQTVDGEVAPRAAITPTLDSSTLPFSKTLILKGIPHDPQKNSTIAIEYTPPATISSFDEHSYSLLEQIAVSPLFGEPAPAAIGNRLDVNGDDALDILDLILVADNGIIIDYNVVCSAGVCSTTYDALSAAECTARESGGFKPPRITRISPIANDANVCSNVLISAKFNNQLGSQAIIERLVTSSPPIDGMKVTVDGKQVKIRPGVGKILEDPAYTITLDSGDWGENGEDIICQNGDQPPCSWTFATKAEQCLIDGVKVEPIAVEAKLVDEGATINIRENMEVAFQSTAIEFSPLMTNVFRCFGQTTPECLVWDQDGDGDIDIMDSGEAQKDAPPVELAYPMGEKWSFADPVARIIDSEVNAGAVLISGNRVTEAVETVIRAEIRDPVSGETRTGEYPFTVRACKNHFVINDTNQEDSDNLKKFPYNEINTNFMITDEGSRPKTKAVDSVASTHFHSHACLDDFEEDQYPRVVSTKKAAEFPGRPFLGVHYVQVPNLATPEEPDAIIVLVGNNNERVSLNEWVTENNLEVGLDSGSLSESLTIDGYPAAQNGTSVYINGADFQGSFDPNRAFTRVYLLSYNEGAQESTKRVFQDLVNNFELNTNLGGDAKARFSRDRQRVFDLTNMQRAIGPYSFSAPQLPAGSFEENHTTSRWNSWTTELGARIGFAPVDPRNEFGVCDDHDPATCWNRTLAPVERFVCPADSYVYQYRYEGGGYQLKAKFEFDKLPVNWQSHPDNEYLITVPAYDPDTDPPPPTGPYNEDSCVNVVLEGNS
ncbi:MAG: hypothetical protein HOJ15_02055 [Candidatus Jacksonbacteria bacterium]|nr:hypothetical protein [Candidatus Jacksonbacteria bacterium]